jgi:uncharacterized protein YcbK (DUF882 family)
MKRIIFHGFTAASFVAIVLILVYGRNIATAQMPTISRTAASRPVSGPAPIEKKTASSRFAGAAASNARLRAELDWDFGGRRHTGWEIYVPLISQTIGVESAPDSPEFAEAVSRWQARNGLPAGGSIDRPTLGAMIKFWQSQRFRRSDHPGDGSLVQAPADDFFDPARSPELRMLERDTYAAYKRMIAAAAKDLAGEIDLTRTGELSPSEKFLKIVSSYRSPEYQAELRRKQPNAGRAALAVNSPHSSGHAIDIYVGGEPVSTKDPNRAVQVRTPAYRWLVKNAHKFGFYPYFYEPWHWEYVPGR